MLEASGVFVTASVPATAKGLGLSVQVAVKGVIASCLRGVTVSAGQVLPDANEFRKKLRRVYGTADDPLAESLPGLLITQ
jgi:hypothetical protein